jgi:hypothetical protein
MHRYLWRESSRFNAGSTSAQGVAWNTQTDRYIFADNSNLYLYNSTSGIMIRQRNTSHDGSFGNKLGDLTYHNGYLYVIASNYPSTPRQATIMRYDPDSLQYIDEIPLLHGGEESGAITYNYGKFWLADASAHATIVRRYNEDFTLDKTFNLTLPVMSGVNHSWNGIAFIGNKMFLNPHANVYPISMTVYEYDHTSDELVYVGQHIRPRDCSQGMFYRPDTKQMIFSLRSSDGGSDAVVRTEIDDVSHYIATRASYTTSPVTTSSSSYTVENAGRTRYYGRTGDVIEVDIIANITTSNGGNVRAYVDLSPGTSSRATLLNNAPTMRTNTTNSEGVTLSTKRWYRMDEDNFVDFNMVWRVSNGSATCINLSIFCKMVGYDTGR